MYDSLIERLIDLAIEEDIATGDITTNAIIPVQAKAVAEMKAKADGVISGLEIAKRVFERFEKDIVLSLIHIFCNLNNKLISDYCYKSTRTKTNITTCF